MIIKYEGRSYPYDFDDVELLPAMAIEERMGMSFSDWADRLEKGGDLRSLQCFGWLVLTGGDVKVPIADTNFKMVRLGEAFAAARAKEAADKAPDPVQPPDPTTGQDSPGPTSAAAAAAVISADGSSAPA